MLYIAIGGLGVNIVMFFILHSGSGHSHGLGSKCSHDHGNEHQHKIQNIADSRCSEICLDDSHSHQT
jgi:Co/Zn/Cd efflux system component